MGIEVKSRVIGEHTYRVEQFGAKKGGRILVRLAKMLGASIGGAIESGDKVDATVIGKTLTSLTDQITEEDYDYLCDNFAAKTRVTGGQYGSNEPKLADFFDSHFAGNYLELGEWLAFCLEANYGSFLAVIGEEAKALAGVRQPPQDSDGEEKLSNAPSESPAT